MGSLLDLAKRDSKFFVTKGGFQESIELTTKSRDMSVSLNGWATKHHISFDTDGNQVNSKNVHCTIDENELISLGYPTRNARNEIDFLKHFVSFKDSSDILRNYIVKEQFPDETLGLIVLILGDYNI